MSGCRQSRRLIDAAFARRELPPREAEQLWEHLRVCQSCRARYDALAWVARAASSADPTAPATWEMTAMRERVLGAAPTHAKARGATGLLALAAAAAAGLLLWYQARPAADSPWGARGGAASAIAVRALCLLTDVSGRPVVRSWTDHPGPDEVDTCPRGSAARISYRSVDRGLLYVGTRSDGAPVTWRHPLEAPLPVVPADRLTLLPLDLGPAVAATARELEIITLFSPMRMSRCELESAVTAGPCPAPATITLTRQLLSVGPGSEDTHR